MKNNLFEKWIYYTKKKGFDFSNSKYSKTKLNTKFICPIHGESWITPSNHLLGRGCKECGKIKQQENRKKRKEKNK